MTLFVPARLKRAGLGTKMVIEGPAGRGRKGKADPSLAKLIVKGHVFQENLIKGGGLSLSDIAVRQGVTRSYFTRLVRLTFLAPDITRAILDGSHPPTLTGGKAQGSLTAAARLAGTTANPGFRLSPPRVEPASNSALRPGEGLNRPDSRR